MGQFTDFKFRLNSLPEGKHDFAYRLGKEFFVNMENDEIHDADVEIKLVVTRHGDSFDLQFHCAGTLTLICTRCLDDLIFPVDTDYHVTVEFGDDYRDENDELMIIPSSDPDLNVAFIIYETIVLTIPIKHVHQPGKCNRQMTALLRKHRGRRDDNDEDTDLDDDFMEGIDDTAGSGSIDSRWDALRGLGSPGSADND